jgi:pantothenate kinase type III
MKELLAIDIGNSNVKYALFVNGKITETWRHPTDQVTAQAAPILKSQSCQWPSPVWCPQPNNIYARF